MKWCLQLASNEGKVGETDKTRLAMIRKMIKAGLGYVGVHYYIVFFCMYLEFSIIWKVVQITKIQA